MVLAAAGLDTPAPPCGPRPTPLYLRAENFEKFENTKSDYAYLSNGVSSSVKSCVSLSSNLLDRYTIEYSVYSSNLSIKVFFSGKSKSASLSIMACMVDSAAWISSKLSKLGKALPVVSSV